MRGDPRLPGELLQQHPVTGVQPVLSRAGRRDQGADTLPLVHQLQPDGPLVIIVCRLSPCCRVRHDGPVALDLDRDVGQPQRLRDGVHDGADDGVADDCELQALGQARHRGVRVVPVAVGQPVDQALRAVAQRQHQRDGDRGPQQRQQGSVGDQQPEHTDDGRGQADHAHGEPP